MAGNKLKEGMVGSLNYWKKQPGAHSVEHMALKFGPLHIILNNNTLVEFVERSMRSGGDMEVGGLEGAFGAVKGDSSQWS